ncbi:unnamed protein product [Larinioides sclopetarius]|uniref:Uncharacterized protein n=1 Tax=Larinioides sclopetarius TaxID=280406 RepID=A0AAV2AC80_9ARAC
MQQPLFTVRVRDALDIHDQGKGLAEKRAKPKRENSAVGIFKFCFYVCGFFAWPIRLRIKNTLSFQKYNFISDLTFLRHVGAFFLTLFLLTSTQFSTDDAVCYSEFRAMRRFGHLESARLCFKLKLEPQSIYLNHVGISALR